MGQPNDVPRDTASPGTEMERDLPDDESHASFFEGLQQSSEEIENADQLTQERLTEEMRSSYWILEELRRLTDDFASESAQSSGSISDDDRAESNDIDPFRPSLPVDDSVVAFVSDLQRQLGGFGADFDDLTERQETRFERFSTEIDHLTDRIAWMEFIHEQFAETNDLDAVTDDLTTANERIAGLQSTTGDLESKIGREFESIETLFHRVLDTLEDLDSELEMAVSSFQEELEPLWARHAERKQLESLKTEAMQRMIRRGDCEQCGHNIDLSLLESPICPGCSSSFIGIDNGGWNPFRSPRFETE